LRQCQHSNALDGRRWFAKRDLLPAATFRLTQRKFFIAGRPDAAFQRRSIWQLVREQVDQERGNGKCARAQTARALRPIIPRRIIGQRQWIFLGMRQHEYAGSTMRLVEEFAEGKAVLIRNKTPSAAQRILPARTRPFRKRLIEVDDHGLFIFL
jgi:hypothetical protein